MYAIKWTSNNPVTKNVASGLVLINDDVNKLNQLLVFNTPEEAESQIEILKKTASSTISFAVIPVKENIGE